MSLSCREEEDEASRASRAARSTLREHYGRGRGRGRSLGGSLGGRGRGSQGSQASLPGGLAAAVGADGKAACSFTTGGRAFMEQHWYDAWELFVVLSFLYPGMHSCNEWTHDGKIVSLENGEARPGTAETAGPM